MRIRRLLCLVLAGCALIAMPAGATPRPGAYVLPGAAVFPEGVAFQRETGHYFVSSTSDGSILRGHVSEPAASPFIPGTTGQFSAIGVELDRAGRLYVAGGATATARVHDAASGALLGTHASPVGGFMNDVAAVKTGDAFVTDSFRPILWRIPAGESETSAALEPWLSYAGTPIQYTPAPDDFEVNGIAASEDGRYLVVVQANAGKLFRIEIATRRVVEIDLGGASVNGDGLELRGAPTLRRGRRRDRRDPAVGRLHQRESGLADERSIVRLADDQCDRPWPHARRQLAIRPPLQRPAGDPAVHGLQHPPALTGPQARHLPLRPGPSRETGPTVAAIGVA